MANEVALKFIVSDDGTLSVLDAAGKKLGEVGEKAASLGGKRLDDGPGGVGLHGIRDQVRSASSVIEGGAELASLGREIEHLAADHAGVVDHIAFLASEPEEFVKRFKQLGMSYRPRSLPDSELFQLFIKDPNGLTIELNFFGIKQAPDWGGEDYSRMERVTAP